MNDLSTSMVDCFKLPLAPHLQPYKVAWIDNSSIPIAQPCLVSFSCNTYSCSVLCEV
jgi:hypothetical protein